MTIKLDAGATPPKGVATPSRLAMFVGDPPRQLLIFTGVAQPEWDSQSDLDRTEVQVRLGATTTANFGWTAQAALASISNEDSDFIFAVDDAFVDTDTDDVKDEVLRLRVPIAVQGEPSVLHRFSYTVHVLSDPIQATISGTISWARSWGEPTFAVTKGGQPVFRVALGQTVNLPGPPGGFGSTKFVEHGAAFSAPPVASGDRWFATYQIHDVPLGQMWEVRPSLMGGAINGPPAGFDASPGFQPFPQMVQLSLAQPSAAGVDFVMLFFQGPR